MDEDRLARMRLEYARIGLDEAAAGHDPLALFRRWLNEVIDAGVPEPNAMALATADARGIPSVRIVLLKGLDDRGAVFYTNYDSHKGRDIADQPHVAAVLLWHELGRQVRFEGTARPLPSAESDAYFANRPVGARISAVASAQSEPVPDRETLEKSWHASVHVADHRPDFWGGYRIEITSWEFWHGRQDRLHDRLCYTRSADGWVRERLAP